MENEEIFNKSLVLETWYPQMTGWVAHFDIEGFKDKLEKNIDSLQLTLGSLVEDVKSKLEIYNHDKKDEYKIYYHYFQDTFIFHSTHEDNIQENRTPFVKLVELSIDFYKKCLEEDLILMGAISYGNIILSKCHKFFFGKAFLEANLVCNNKKFFKLLLAKSAVDQLMKMLPKENYKKSIGNFVNLLADKKLKYFIENHDHTYVYNFCGYYFGDGYINDEKNKHYNPTIQESFKRNKPNEEGCEKINKRYETTLKFIDTVKGLGIKAIENKLNITEQIEFEKEENKSNWYRDTLNQIEDIYEGKALKFFIKNLDDFKERLNWCVENKVKYNYSPLFAFTLNQTLNTFLNKVRLFLPKIKNNEKYSDVILQPKIKEKIKISEKSESYFSAEGYSIKKTIHSNLNMWFGNVAELLFANYLKTNEYQISNMEAWDDKACDVEAEKDNVNYYFEIKTIGENPEVIQQLYGPDAGGFIASPIKKLSPNLVERFKEAKVQFEKNKMMSEQGQKILVFMFGFSINLFLPGTNSYVNPKELLEQEEIKDIANGKIKPFDDIWFVNLLNSFEMHTFSLVNGKLN